MVLNSNSTKAALGSRVAALEMLYSLYVLQRWEACWGLSKALSLTRNQAALFCDIGCPPISDKSGIYFSQKLEILINRKHRLNHDYGAVAIKFSMSNTRRDFCFSVEWTNSEKKKQCEASLEVRTLCIQVFVMGGEVAEQTGAEETTAIFD